MRVKNTLVCVFEILIDKFQAATFFENNYIAFWNEVVPEQSNLNIILVGVWLVYLYGWFEVGKHIPFMH